MSGEFGAMRPSGGSWAAVTLAALALASLLEVAGGAVASTVAAILGVTAAVLVACRAHAVLEWGARLCGGLGLLPALWSLVADERCSSIPMVWRLITAALAVVAVVISLLAGLVGATHALAAPLAIYGVVRVAGFASSPAAGAMLGGGELAWLIAPLVAVALGFTAVWSPSAVIGLSIVVVIVGALAEFALPGAPCGGGSPSDIPVMTAVTVCYLLTRMLLKVVVRR